jgi:hypothetical protein
MIECRHQGHGVQPVCRHQGHGVQPVCRHQGHGVQPVCSRCAAGVQSLRQPYLQGRTVPWHHAPVGGLPAP